MKEIIVRLYKIFGLAKDLHYTSSGPEFYGLHLMFDRIADGLLDHADRIQESYFMPRQLPPPSSAEIFAKAAEGKQAPSAAGLLELIRSTIYRIDQLTAETPDFSEGDKTILGDISADLAAKAGFLTRTLKQGEKGTIGE